MDAKASDLRVVGERYYHALDTHAYDELDTVLAPSFTQYRPDRTFTEKHEFIEFMRSGRPNQATTHTIDTWFVSPDSEDASLVAQGTLHTAEDATLFDFVDVMTFNSASRLVTLRTYTH